jgi:hypothetical protein
VEKQSTVVERQLGKSEDFAAFISHAKADQKRAHEIAASLEERGLKCWIAPRDVQPGQSYGDEIIRGIEKSRSFILILSKASNESPFVAREVERAVSKRKPIFPIRVEDVVPSSSLELFISSTQWIDAFADDGSETDRIANLLAADEGSAPRVIAASSVAAPRSSGWLRPAVLGVALLLGGLIGVFLWTFYGRTPESAPPPAPVASTPPAVPQASQQKAPSPASPQPEQAAAPTLAAPQLPSAAPPASPQAKPEQVPAPAVAPPQPQAAEPAVSLEAKPEQSPAAGQPELPRPHAANEECSRSGDATLCVSSVLAPERGNTYGPRNLTDGNNNTAWVEGSSGQGVGDFVVLEFDSPRMISGLTIRNGYDKSADIFAKNSRVKDIELRFSSGESIDATLKDVPGPQHLALDQPINAKWIELIIRSVYPGSKYSDTAINALSVDAQ